MTYTFDESIVSDLYKDANGCRPSAVWLRAFKSMSDRDKQDEWEYLCKLVEEACEAERRAEDTYYQHWSSKIRDMMAALNISEAEAIEMDMADCDCVDDVGFYCFRRGLSYSVEYEIDNILKGK